MRVIIIKKDGDKKEFDDAYGLFYKGVFAIVEDGYGNNTSIPAADIKEIKTESRRW